MAAGQEDQPQLSGPKEAAEEAAPVEGAEATSPGQAQLQGRWQGTAKPPMAEEAAADETQPQSVRPKEVEEPASVEGVEPPDGPDSSSKGPHTGCSGSRRGVAGAGRLSWVGCDERSADRGAATVWVIGGIAVLMSVVYLVIWFLGAVVARHEAEGAADLGALAAAVVAADGEQAACAEARWVVERMGAVLLSCRLSGWDALVEAEVGYAPFGSAAGRARAGPVELHG